jgi:hypothetical protein
VSDCSTQLLLKKCFAPINTSQVTPENNAEMHVGPHVNFHLVLSSINKQDFMNIWLSTLELLHADRQTDGRKDIKGSIFAAIRLERAVKV